MGNRIRFPFRAGSFYEASEKLLRKQIEGCFVHHFGPGNLPKARVKGSRKIISLISPHAGYAYSGPVAANGYYSIAEDGRPDSVIVVGPNHTGYGSGVSIMTQGIWRTPLGDVGIDSELARKIQGVSKFVDVDEIGHRYEHSIEVQLPFLQYIYGFFRFVPICMMMQDLEVSRDLGDAIAQAVIGKNVLIIASTDFTHYEPQNIAETKDNLVLDTIIRLDEAALQTIIEAQGISMCGYGPVTATIIASKRLGAEKTVLKQYKTSGDMIGNTNQVVGYASLCITK